MPAPDAAVPRSTRDAYAQPTPAVLYVHDDLTDEVRRREGGDGEAAELARALLAVLRGQGPGVRVLTLEQQVERVLAAGPHAPFGLALGIGRAGERVASVLHARARWFPRVRRLGLTREEDGAGDYRVVSTEPDPLSAQLAGVTPCATLAVVDDTVFSGLTMRTVLEALPSDVRGRAHAFCLRGTARALDSVAALCPVTAGVVAPGRLFHDVSFVNATGLVLRLAIRRRGQPPLAFFDRPEWIRAWFPAAHAEVLELCRRLNLLLEPAPAAGEDGSS